MPAAMGWDNVGDFDSLAELVPERTRGPADGVAVLDDSAAGSPAADVEALASPGALVALTTGRKIALLGVSCTVVVDTPDALLVTAPDQAQAVKGVVDGLRAEGHSELL